MIQTRTQPKRKVKAHHHAVKLMGCGFVFTAVSDDPQIAWDGIRAAVAEVIRIENMISSWKTNSFTSVVNRQSGIAPVKVPLELIKLVERSIKVSDLTQGAFDITGTLARDYYQFDGKQHAPLSHEQLEALRERMDYRLIQVDRSNGTLYLKKEGMKIGFGGIGKGYAAERAKAVMEAMGVKSGMVNASGDLKCWGNPPNKSGWEIYLPDPDDRSKPLLFLTIPNGSIVTSGNHENFTLVNGKHLSHIVCPRTALPVVALQTVSVICPDAELGDALATGLTVLGAHKGLDLVNRLPGVECVLIDADNHRFFSHHLSQQSHA